MKFDPLIEGSEKKSTVQELKPFLKVITQLFSFPIFPVLDFSGPYLRNYMRDLNETQDIDG